MTNTNIEKVSVLGAGNMGHGIVEVVAIAGYDVTMRDVEEDLVADGYEDIKWSLEKLAEKDRLDESVDDILDRIDTAVELEPAVADADLVIEAAPERMDLKKDIFGDLDAFAPDNALLASNTSSLSITEMAPATSRPEDVVGMHFFNPPVKMDLVEVIYGEETSDETAEVAYEFVESLDKTPIYVRKDVHGFVVNTVLGPFIDEPAWMVSNEEATIREADAAMVHRRGYPMGPFELVDLSGIDVGYHVRTEAERPIPPIMEEKVEANELGRKTGRGYYDYKNGDGVNYEPSDGERFDTLRIEARMVNEAARLVGDDVATPDEIDTGVRLGLGFPEGICRRGDEIGLDAVLDKLRSLHEKTGADRFEPDDYLVELVEQGRTGEDAGTGFHDYGLDGGDGPGEYRLLNYVLSGDGLLEVELDRPERMNALSMDLLGEIDELLSSVNSDDVRCVTFEGAGDRAFSAGADIGGFADLDPTDAMDVTPAFETVNDFERPTIAKIDGYCLGAGLELALACDLRVATADAEFGSPEIGLGLIPGGGGTQRLLRLLGETRAKELVFRGNRIDAERAEEWGLVNRAVPTEEFDDTVSQFVDDVLEGPPVGLKVAKKVMNEGADASLDAALAMESQGFGLLMSTEDVREGTAAFRDNRDPEFRGE
ncbi:3-hydroxybutyryl-CoA dehydrogenase (plasmid) [Haloferax mediterranei ATCC 33500]|uniref:3-hydroxybutyryl-CoA dehydrogenase n=1 Tax=Haloferax mediterranei (strain ATCC 33500 / DSM 1411 / JCM 8866 / NBRC 14739 / NCIMB 2177 / R-4) TaxID=523841 RepID=I3R901_HALMT|nr:3-hydroxyacyl-CoA dehydrogenase NAD-binding domain-containing protein [Haloferax mediterranei]AFK20711.1 3-hydroxybutyryl-CoA dehydrogenase [Haloferax mediterranei ATCC 33500]AHZ24033.1 3-hydroxybutyryl-CoA dehydrogenase [Haloferax mediterranei ATCC 33500]ELZ97619.1 3-hydroxybutyryl-CoA dehydrogenase [Haloferax mediterranei ATCC 33500]MDX5989706.1 3-hydroxyacyl-CoA dehydrogenase NAD-binding domain-containing protein [Haloferax mediterranei ATCC 33500]QCQ77395.1 3-hydroxybutyryl-CoA dehydrog